MKNTNSRSAAWKAGIAVLFALFLGLGEGRAALILWTGSTSGAWGTGSNWSTGTVPLPTDSETFNNVTNQTITLGANRTAVAMTFNAPDAYTFLAGNTLTLGATVTQNGAGTVTFYNTVTTAAAGTTFLGTGTGAVTLGGVISGTGPLTMNGTGSLALLGNNTYSGTTTLQKGTLIVGTDTALGTGTFVFAGGTLVATGGARTLANPVQFTGRNLAFNSTDNLTLNGNVAMTRNIRMTVGNVGVLTLNGVVSGNGRNLRKLGTGTLVLNGANTFSGGLDIRAGTTVVGNNAAAGTGTLTLRGGAIQAGGAARTLTNAVTVSASTIFGGAYDLTFTGATSLTASATLSVQNSNTTFSGDITGGGGSILSKSGTGTLILGGVNSNFGGGLVILNGTAILDSNNAAGTGTITVGDILTTSTSPATLLFSATAGRTVGNAINVPAGSTGLRTIGGLNTVGVNTFSGAVTLGTGVTLTEAAGGEVRFTGVMSGTGGVTKTGAGTVRLSNANTFTGATLVSAGTLAFGINNALGTGTVTVNGPAAILDLGAFTDTVGAVTLQDGSITGTAASLLTSTSGFTVRNGAVTARLGGAVTLTKDTAGTVTLSGVNTYTGGTNVNAGTLNYGASNVLADTGAVTVNGGTLNIGAFSDTVGAVTLTSGSILGTTGVLTGTGYTLQSGTVTAALGGAGINLTKNTAGTVLISGANTYTGTTTVSAGTLRLGATETLPNASATTIAAGATLDLNNFSDTVGSLAGAGNLLLGSGVLTSGGNNTSTSFTGTIGGTGGITKTGTGTLTLSGLDSYSGGTNVNAGTLALGNAAAGPSASRVTVALGATFNVAGFNAGIGSLAGAGAVTLGAGTLTAGGDNTSSTFSGVVSGTGGFTKAGVGTLTMTGVNTFSGGLTVNAGNVVLSGAAGTAASVSAVSILTGASLVLDNSAGENLNRIGNTAAINIQGGDLKLISDANGTTEAVGQLSFLSGPSNITVVHNGTSTQSSALTFSSIGSVVLGTSLNFTGTGGPLGAGLYGPHIYITGQPYGLIGGWARVGTDFAEYLVDGVHAFSNYYTGSDGINVNDSTKIVLLDSTSPLGAYTLTNAGTTTDGGLSLSTLALVDLNTSATRTLNLLSGGLIKKSAPDTVISGAGRLTAGGTAAGGLYVAVETGRKLTIASSIINNAGADGIYGNAGDGVVSIVKSDFGTLVLSGTNTFTGGTYLNEGTVAVSADANLGAAASGVFLSGGTLNVTTGFTANVARRFVLTAGLTSTVDVAAAQSLTLTGANDLLATGSTASVLIKTGTGDLVLGGANPNFTGTARISSGALELRNAGSLGTGSIALDGGTLRLRADASTAFSNPFTLVSNSTIAASTITAGTPVLSLGAVSIGAQTLSLSATGGATLSLAGGSLAGNATFNATAGTTTIGAISGAFGFTKTGAGVLQLTAPGTYTGATDVQGGILRLANATGVTPASNVNTGASGTVDLNNLNANLGSITGTGTIALGSATLTVGGNGLASNFAGVISGTGGLTKIAGETLTLAGASTYAGATSITTGELLLGGTNALPSATTVDISAGAKLNLATFNQTVRNVSGSGTLAVGTGTLTVGDATNFAFAGDMTGSGTVRKVGAGAWSLSGNSPFTGSVIVAGGTIEVLADNALGDPVVMAGAQIVLAPGVNVITEPLMLAGTGSAGAGALRVDGGTSTWTGPIQFSAAASTGAAAGATLSLSGDISLSGQTMTVSGAGNTTSTGIISGTGSLQKADAGTLTLAGANTFTGPVVVAAGTLSVAADAALGASGAGNQTQVLSGATLMFADPVGININSESLSIAGNGVSGNGAIHVVSGDNTSTGPVTLTADASITTAAGSSLSLVGGIGQSTAGRSLVKNAAGTLALGGTNTFTGMLTVNDGTLQIAADNALGGNPGVTLAATATLDLNDFSDSLGSLSGSGTVTFGPSLTGGGLLKVGANGASTTFSGIITDIGDFQKIGAGSLTLTAANTYTGDTTISGGTLVAGNNLAFGASTQTVTIDGGTLASNNDARTLAYNVVTGTTPGSRIGGSNSITLTGSVTGPIGSELDVNFSDSSKKLIINPSTAGAFAPATVSLTSGTLLLGGPNKIADSTNLILAGGKLDTGGNSDTVGALTLVASSTLDFGTTNNVSLDFAAAAWTGGTLIIDNWTGFALSPGNPDKFLVSSVPSTDFLDHVSFTGFLPGARAIAIGGGLYEIVPVPEPGTILGGLVLFGLVAWRERRRLGQFLGLKARRR